jgi:hypothetical protein
MEKGWVVFIGCYFCLLIPFARALVAVRKAALSSVSSELKFSRTHPTDEDEADHTPMTNAENRTSVDLGAASQFKVLTCSSTACSKQRMLYGVSEPATFSSLYIRIMGSAPTVRIEECPCLGHCKKGPCVAIEHDDYDGPVSLEGMDNGEFVDRVFHRVLTDDDADRVWSVVYDAIQAMADEEGDCAELHNEDYI